MSINPHSTQFNGFLFKDLPNDRYKYLLSAGIPEAVVVVFSSLSSTAELSITKFHACKDLAASTASRTPLTAQDRLIKGGLGGGQEHKAGQDTQQQ